MKIRFLSSNGVNEKEQIMRLQDEWVDRGLLPNDFQKLDAIIINNENTIVAEINSKIVAYLVFVSNKEGDFEIDSIYKSKSSNYANLGKELIERAEQEIKSLGGTKVVCCPMTTKDKAKLENYYIELGYVKNGNIMEKKI